jgi:D-psicose/D-tagatose/L-ribulose 3-epimerase
MRTSMNLLLWTTNVTAEHYPLLKKIRETGFDGVEIPVFEGDESHYRAIGKELKSLGLASTAVTVCGVENNPISPDPAARKKGLEHIKWALNNIAAMGGEILCGPYHSALGHFSGNPPTEDEKKWAVEVLRAAAEHGQNVGVKLAIEYLNRFECYFLTHAVEARALVKAVNHPNFKMMYDTFHAHIEEKDAAKTIAGCLADTIHVHISENDRGTPGTGQVHWKETFRALRKGGYDGWLTIEAFGRALPALAAATKVWRDLFPHPEEVYTQGLRFMKVMWDEAK